MSRAVCYLILTVIVTGICAAHENKNMAAGEVISPVAHLILDAEQASNDELEARYEVMLQAANELIFAVCGFAPDRLQETLRASDARVVDLLYSVFIADQIALAKRYRAANGKAEVINAQLHRLTSLVGAYPLSVEPSAEERLLFTKYLAEALPIASNECCALLRHRLTNLEGAVRLPIAIALAELGDEKTAKEVEGLTGMEVERLRTIFRMYMMNSPYRHDYKIETDAEQK